MGNRLLHRIGLGVRRDLTLASFADELGRLHGERVVLTEELPDGSTRQLTAVGIADVVGRWSAAIAARTEPGQRVVVATPNGVDQLLACLAASRVGRLAVPVNAQMSATEVDHVIDDCDASLVVRDGGELQGGPGSRSAPPPAHRPDAGAVAALFYTSGTTGRPKGAELTHRSLLGSLSAAVLAPPLPGGHEVLMSLPVAHIMGFISLLGPLVMGMPVYFVDRFSAGRILDVIEERRCRVFVGVPAMYRMMLEAGAADRDLSSVRAWVSGADVMPTELARAFKSMGAAAHLPVLGAVGEAAFLEGYGMVEVGGGVAAKVSPPFIPAGMGDSLGVFLPGWKARVVDEDGQPIGRGRVGELQLRGPGVLRGYWDDSDATTAAFTEDGWLRTGDLVRLGPLRTVAFAGRSKHVVKSGGYSVYPLEVEADLEEHPDVLEAAVTGLADPKLGEMVVAAVRLRRGARVDGDDLLAWSRARMADYKAPRRILVVHDLPRTGTRKVQREEVAALFVDAGERES
jgi:acyl-CoA synthetase (AMP-forming)/AMP-acid ligase II